MYTEKTTYNLSYNVKKKTNKYKYVIAIKLVKSKIAILGQNYLSIMS